MRLDFLPMIEAAGRSFGVDVFTHPVHDTAEIERVINTFAAEQNGGLIPVASALIGVQRDFVISLANRHRLPNVYAFRYYPANGGLASYGVDNIDLYKRAASYIDRILLGPPATVRSLTAFAGQRPRRQPGESQPR